MISFSPRGLAGVAVVAGCFATIGGACVGETWMEELRLGLSMVERAWVCRANPDALGWSLEASSTQVLSGSNPAYISRGAATTLDLTWLLVGWKTGSTMWHSSQNFGAEFPVRGLMQ
jgi:hypothetical protein